MTLDNLDIERVSFRRESTHAAGRGTVYHFAELNVTIAEITIIERGFSRIIIYQRQTHVQQLTLFRTNVFEVRFRLGFNGVTHCHCNVILGN